MEINFFVDGLKETLEQDKVFIRARSSSNSSYKELTMYEGNSGELTININNNPYKANKYAYYGYDTDAKIFCFRQDGKWVDSYGRTVAIKYGGTLSLPDLEPNDIGFRFYNTDTENSIMWDGEKWLNEDGTLTSKVIII